jgi:hypothetical protein
MSTVVQIINSIEHMFENDAPDVDKIVSFILVEKWNHEDYEELEYHNLTNSDLDILNGWASINSHTYDRVRDLVADMIEVFPGLSVIAASWIVAPYCGNSRLRRIK